MPSICSLSRSKPDSRTCSRVSSSSRGSSDSKVTASRIVRSGATIRLCGRHRQRSSLMTSVALPTFPGGRDDSADRHHFHRVLVNNPKRRYESSWSRRLHSIAFMKSVTKSAKVSCIRSSLHRALERSSGTTSPSRPRSRSFSAVAPVTCRTRLERRQKYSVVGRPFDDCPNVTDHSFA